MTPLTHNLVNARAENALAHNLVEILGWSRPFLQQAVAPELFIEMQRAGILRYEQDKWHCTIRVSTLGEFYFIHSAFPTQDSQAIFFGPDTYRFVLALKHDFSAKRSAVRRAVDIGTGSGAGALYVARNFPDAEVFGVDINPLALAYAQFNANVNQFPQVKILYSDLLTQVKGQFDLILANPPYLVDKRQRLYRHGGGQYGYQLSLDIVRCALERLSTGGTLLLYTGALIIAGNNVLLNAVTKLLIDQPFSMEYEELEVDVFAEELLHPPYHRADRIAAAVFKVHRLE